MIEKIMPREDSHSDDARYKMDPTSFNASTGNADEIKNFDSLKTIRSRMQG